MCALDEALKIPCILLAIFSAGLGVPFAVFGVLAQGALSHPRLRRGLPLVRTLAAAVMLAAGLLLISGQFTQLAARSYLRATSSPR